MSTEMLSYIDRPSFIHKLSGITKLIFFLLWSTVAMISYDIRILLVMLCGSFLIFKISKIRFKEISFIFWLIIIFLALNTITIYIFSPREGVHLYGSSHVLLKGIGRYNLTEEQLFYLSNIILKYLVVTPIALLFVTTTHPSEFASSLNKVGVSYKIAYAVALALRYIPDIQRDFKTVSKAQQARGIDLSSKSKLRKRIKNYAMILIPLILSSLDRVELIDNAMELRSFGKKNKRTWYSEKSIKKRDIAVLFVSIVLFVLSFSIMFMNHSRFYNIFKK